MDVKNALFIMWLKMSKENPTIPEKTEYQNRVSSGKIRVKTTLKSGF